MVNHYQAFFGGLALGAALLHTGAVERLIYHGRSLDPPPHPIFEPGPLPAEYRIGPFPVAPGTSILILAVADTASTGHA